MVVLTVEHLLDPPLLSEAPECQDPEEGGLPDRGDQGPGRVRGESGGGGGGGDDCLCARREGVSPRPRSDGTWVSLRWRRSR